MTKSLRDYISESEHWTNNPVAGDDFAINFREECLVESYVLETRRGAVVIQADEEMIRIMESYGCSLEDLEEQQSQHHEQQWQRDHQCHQPGAEANLNDHHAI